MIEGKFRLNRRARRRIGAQSDLGGLFGPGLRSLVRLSRRF